MRYGRIAGAAAMGALAAALLAAYPAAVRREAPPEPVEAEAPRAAEPAMELALEPELEPEALALVVRREDGAAGQTLRVYDADGRMLDELPPCETGEYVLRLAPEAEYEIETSDALRARFYLGENASVRNVTGEAWSDGELLRLDRAPRCTVHIRGLPAGLCTLQGPGYRESRAAEDGACLFTGLPPGDYELTAGTGTVRPLHIGPEQRDLLLALE